MQTTPKEGRYLAIKEIRDILSISKTKGHQIAGQIRDVDEDPNAGAIVPRSLDSPRDCLADNARALSNRPPRIVYEVPTNGRTDTQNLAMCREILA